MQIRRDEKVFLLRKNHLPRTGGDSADVCIAPSGGICVAPTVVLPSSFRVVHGDVAPTVILPSSFRVVHGDDVPTVVLPSSSGVREEDALQHCNISTGIPDDNIVLTTLQ